MITVFGTLCQDVADLDARRRREGVANGRQAETGATFR